MITLQLSEQETATVMEALSNLPLHRSFDVFVNVRNQLVQQRTQAAQQQGAQLEPSKLASTNGKGAEE